MIIEIAIGIVLAVLILSFLPALIVLGGVFIVISVALVVAGILLYWIGSNPAVLGFIALFSIGVLLYLPWAKRDAIDAPVRDLKERVRRRKSLGYDTSDLDVQLSGAISDAAQAKRAR